MISAGLRRFLALLTVLLLVFWPQPALGLSDAGGPPDGARLFLQTCAGCHPNGGNIIRRGRGLKESVLRRQGIDSAEAVAHIAAAGIGRMDGYGAALGEGGAEAVGAWVWQQALADWPRQKPPAGLPSTSLPADFVDPRA
ncbi:MAG: c-type cytochrome [Synechococcaceae cyanobacterium]